MARILVFEFNQKPHSNMGKSMKKTTMKSKAKKSTAMRKRKAAKKPSIVAKGRGAKARVFFGKKSKTVGGLKKGDLVKSKSGKIVSRKSSERAKKAYRNNGLSKYAAALKKARAALGIKGFVPIGGKTPRGQALLKKLRSYI